MNNVRIRSFSDPYFPVLSPDAEKYKPEKLRIRTLFTQCNMHPKNEPFNVIQINTCVFILRVAFIVSLNESCYSIFEFPATLLKRDSNTVIFL